MDRSSLRETESRNEEEIWVSALVLKLLSLKAKAKRQSNSKITGESWVTLKY